MTYRLAPFVDPKIEYSDPSPRLTPQMRMNALYRNQG